MVVPLSSDVTDKGYPFVMTWNRVKDNPGNGGRARSIKYENIGNI